MNDNQRLKIRLYPWEIEFILMEKVMTDGKPEMISVARHHSLPEVKTWGNMGYILTSIIEALKQSMKKELHTRKVQRMLEGKELTPKEAQRELQKPL